MEAGVGVGRILVYYGSPQMQKSGFWTIADVLLWEIKVGMFGIFFYAFWLFSNF